MEMTFRIRRFLPPEDKKPHYQDYTLAVEPGMTVLDCLNQIKWTQDGSLTYRMSCRSMICGSCAMAINGKNALACGLQALSLKQRLVRIDPLPGFKVIKDLVVDLDPFWENFEKIKPYLINYDEPPERERLQSPEERQLYDEVLNCIMCGACTSSCPSFWTNPDYLGPAAIVKAYRFLADSRDQGEDERLPALNQELAGVWRCHTIYNCVEACPKGIDTTWVIGQIKLRLLNRSLSAKPR